MNHNVDAIQASDFLEKAVLDSLDQPLGNSKVRHMEERHIGRGGKIEPGRANTYATFDIVAETGQVLRVAVWEVRS